MSFLLGLVCMLPISFMIHNILMPYCTQCVVIFMAAVLGEYNADITRLFFIAYLIAYLSFTFNKYGNFESNPKGYFGIF